MTDQITVTQADRDAAADLAQYAGLYPTLIVDRLRDGTNDRMEIIQAFARHRIAAERTASAEPVVDRTSQAYAVMNPQTGSSASGIAGTLYNAPPSADVGELVEALRAIANLRQHSREDDADNALTMQDMAVSAIAKHRSAR